MTRPGELHLPGPPNTGTPTPLKRESFGMPSMDDAAYTDLPIRIISDYLVARSQAFKVTFLEMRDLYMDAAEIPQADDPEFRLPEWYALSDIADVIVDGFLAASGAFGVNITIERKAEPGKTWGALMTQRAFLADFSQTRIDVSAAYAVEQYLRKLTSSAGWGGRALNPEFISADRFPAEIQPIVAEARAFSSRLRGIASGLGSQGR